VDACNGRIEERNKELVRVGGECAAEADEVAERGGREGG
jgi:hypothetical protein